MPSCTATATHLHWARARACAPHPASGTLAGRPSPGLVLCSFVLPLPVCERVATDDAPAHRDGTPHGARPGGHRHTHGAPPVCSRLCGPLQLLHVCVDHRQVFRRLGDGLCHLAARLPLGRQAGPPALARPPRARRRSSGCGPQRCSPGVLVVGLGACASEATVQLLHAASTIVQRPARQLPAPTSTHPLPPWPAQPSTTLQPWMPTTPTLSP